MRSDLCFQTQLPKHFLGSPWRAVTVKNANIGAEMLVPPERNKIRR
jgi:hypothetical protein